MLPIEVTKINNSHRYRNNMCKQLMALLKMGHRQNSFRGNVWHHKNNLKNYVAACVACEFLFEEY